MSDDMPLFNAPPERAGAYTVPTLRAQGVEKRGDWTLCWGEAKHALYSRQDREAVMRLLGLDPEAWVIYDSAPINILAAGFKRSWWYIWPKDRPSPRDYWDAL